MRAEGGKRRWQTHLCPTGRATRRPHEVGQCRRAGKLHEQADRLGVGDASRALPVHQLLLAKLVGNENYPMGRHYRNGRSGGSIAVRLQQIACTR
jgi:hypothetical protein